MSISIDDAVMSSPDTPHTARFVRREAGNSYWRVSWLPGREVGLNQAITAMMIAQALGAGVAADSDQWLFIDGWAAELGLTGAQAVRLVCRPLVGDGAAPKL